MRRLFCIVVVAGALVGIGTAHAESTLAVEIEKKAVLVSPTEVMVTGTVTCPAGATVVEAFLYVVQDGNQSQFAALPVVCDGSPHEFGVTVTTIDFVFSKGKAQVSSFVLLETGEAVSPVATVKIKRT